MLGFYKPSKIISVISGLHHSIWFGISNVLPLMIRDKKKYVSKALHLLVAFIQATKQQVDLTLLLYRSETNTTSKARCPKCCWLSLPPSLLYLPSISQPGSHWTLDPSPCGMMKPSLVFSCTGGYTQCQVLEQNGSGTTGRLETLHLWSSWKRITRQTFNMRILLQCLGQNFLTQMFGPSY